MQDPAGEVGTSSYVMYSSGPLDMDEQRPEGQLEPTYSSSLPIQDVALKTSRNHWNIGMGWQKKVREICADSASSSKI